MRVIDQIRCLVMIIVTFLLTKRKYQAFSIKLISLSFIFISSSSLHAQSALDSLNYFYNGVFDSINAPTGFLLNKGFIYEERVEPYFLAPNQTFSDRLISTNPEIWKNTYSYLRRSQVNSISLLPDLNVLYKKPSKEDPNVLVGIIFIDGDYVRADSIEANLDSISNKLYLKTKTSIVNIFSVSTLERKVYSDQPVFNIRNNFYFSNKNSNITGFSIDFDDGLGFRNYPFNAMDIAVKYTKPGEKNIIFKILIDSDTLISTSNIYVSFINKYLSREADIEALTENGTVVKAKYKIYSGCANSLAKPLIIVEGFDYKNEIIFDEVFEKYERAGMIEDILLNGYNFISFQFVSNNGDLQMNAQVLKRFIKYINAEKNNPFENIIIGESMGGIITRIALAELEKEGVDHMTGLYISFDSPQGGANIPLSIQEWPNNLLNIDLDDIFFFLPESFRLPLSFFDVGDALDALDSIDPIQNMLQAINSNNSEAARQMTIRHRDYPKMLNPDYLNLQERLNKLGYPIELRKIALINGSNSAIGQPFSLEESYIDISFSVKCVVRFNCRAFVSPVNQKDFEASLIRLKFGCWIFSWTPISERGIFDFFEKPYDNCPGSTQKFKILDNVIPTFVPTVSSIDLNKSIVESPNGLYYFNEQSSDFKRRKKHIVSSNMTPFDDIYSNRFNTNHIDLDGVKNILPEIKEKEIMFHDLYLQNQIIKNTWRRQYYADNIVTVGRNVNDIWENKEIEKSDFEILTGSEVKIVAGNRIRLMPGTKVELGASLKGRIENFDCINNSLSYSTTSKRISTLLNDPLNPQLIRNSPPVQAKELWEFSFEAYPNPTNDNINITINAAKGQKIEVAILNLLGNEIVKYELNPTLEEKTGYKLNIPKLPPGMYILCCKNHGHMVSKKIMLL